MTEDAQVLVLRARELQPGDQLVLETQQVITAQQAAALKARLVEKFPQIHPEDVIVLSGAHLSVIRPA